MTSNYQQRILYSAKVVAKNSFDYLRLSLSLAHFCLTFYPFIYYLGDEAEYDSSKTKEMHVFLVIELSNIFLLTDE